MEKDKALREEIRKEVLAEIFPTIQFIVNSIKLREQIVEEKEKICSDLAVKLLGYEAVKRIIEKNS